MFILGQVDPVVAISIIAAGLGPIGAYLIAARRMSGKIGNSDAEQLWAESSSIRKWSKERIDAYELQIRNLRDAFSNLSDRCSALEAENTSLHDQLRNAQERIAELVDHLADRSGGGYRDNE